MKSSIILLLPILSYTVHCANILGVFNIASLSHQIVYQPIWRELSRRGHSVTVVTPNPLNDASLINLTEIDIGPPLYKRVKELSAKFSSKPSHWIFNPLFLYKYVDSAEIIFSNPEVSALINDTARTFDVVIAEYAIPIGAAFAAKFKCPLVGVLSIRITNILQEQIGIPNHPVLYPEIVAPYGTEPDFFDRVGAVVNDIFLRMFYRYVAIPRYDRVIKKHFGKDYPYYGDLERNVSIMLMNSSPYIHGARPLGPNVIELGRMHIQKDPTLPQDLQEYLDAATEGAIYFSLGSNVKSMFMDVEKRTAFLQTFAHLPFKVLWKFEPDLNLTAIPKNVKIRDWFPQQAVLAHPNIKLFISQGGLQSIEEAIVCKIPILVIPFIFDQDYNAKRIVQLGIGLSLDFGNVNEENLNRSILEIIMNPRYKDAIRELSDAIVDEPMTGIEKAIFWVEYVIRHKGARYLTSPLQDIPWYKFLVLDVMSFLFLVCSIVIYSFYKTVVLVLRPCFKRSEETSYVKLKIK